MIYAASFALGFGLGWIAYGFGLRAQSPFRMEEIR